MTRALISDVLMLTGSGLLVYGVALIHPAAAWIVAGLVCIGIGLMTDR